MCHHLLCRTCLLQTLQSRRVLVQPQRER
ncbi:MAG: hypothetical protein ACFFDQ_01530 [Candidatus Thorarchaeota archaeon]